MPEPDRPPHVLTPSAYADAVARLCARDPALAAMVARWGAPPLWTHPRGFAGLALAVLAQLVSLESAHATWHKLRAAVPELTPAHFVTLGEDRLRQLGCSRAKAGYLLQMARDMLAGELDLAALETWTDDAARQRLQQLRGVGRWTADTYLLFSLCRADAWPSGDLALEKALADPLAANDRMPTAAADRMAERWRPWRAVAARILWSQYLHVRGRFETVSRSWASVRAAAADGGA